jgi:hypothetical protein
LLQPQKQNPLNLIYYNEKKELLIEFPRMEKEGEIQGRLRVRKKETQNMRWRRERERWVERKRQGKTRRGN